jgi:cytochrome oxidase Cu insertion factor (SCO1/SenC/PrrC family)
LARDGRRVAGGAGLSRSDCEEAVALIIMSTMLTAGVTAPELDSVVDHDGNPVRLADLRGRWVLLWWYPMADTPG